MTTSSAEWAPSSCTLPTADRPLRIAEFDNLFTTAARRVERLGPTRARILLLEAARAQAADITARETACCSFFTFTFTPADADTLWLGVEVPGEQVAVLDGLIERASGLVAS
ncbi:hypothetical protein [Cryptosporangium sp. NPDC051539]|uniref:hypothetical protein n=1 Tax=Cryptosporangium sp. NPDC051539 TaxID=3363962 RepID=UPI0037A82AB5